MHDTSTLHAHSKRLAGVSSGLDVPPDAWELTRAITPRAAVRVLEDDGAVSYRTSQNRPERPWAMYLARRIGRGIFEYHHLGFDFDAHEPDGGRPAPVVAAAREARRMAVLDDVAVLVDHLTRLGIRHVVCRSSQSGGHHVWIALSEGLSPATAARIGRAAHTLMPTLDYGMLGNPHTGCLRPPLSPHRDGSRSELVAGTLTTLREPTTTIDDATALLDALRAAQPAPAPVPGAANTVTARPAPLRAVETYGTLPVDADGHVYLPGSKRALPAAAAKALREPVRLLDDASQRLATILCGAARAHWRYDDMLQLVDAEPGLERLRTMRAGDLRVARPTSGPTSAAVVLKSEWTRAVRHVASTPTNGVGDDETFTMRLAAVVGIADHVQQRADAMPGRWARHGGPADRRILDRLTTYALAAVTASVEADVRRLAIDTGMSRESARRALLRLRADGWLALVDVADGARAARWLIDPQNALHRETVKGVSQAATPARRRLHLLEVLRSRTRNSAHDVFTYGALGLHAGNVYARLLEHTPPHEHDRALQQLLDHDLARAHGPRIQPGPDHRDAIARRLGAAGTIERRAARYRLEREVWAWWLAELDWMTTRGRAKTARRSTAPVLWSEKPGDHYPAMPRTAGRIRFDLARAQAAAGLLAAPELHLERDRLAA